jgi:signal peptide peptidase SppA
MPTKNNPLLARFDSVPFLVAPEMQAVFETCLAQAAVHLNRIETSTDKPKMLDGDDFWYADDDWRAFFRPYVVKDGILQIPVKGVLLHDFPYQLGSWATGYIYIWKAFERGMGDANVRGIALIEDSPGGEVAGNFDLVDKMFAMKGEKPIRAYAMESAYSAAYSIASVADIITVSRTGGVGSIGVVTAHVDWSKAMEAEGVKVTFIHAGKHKVDGNPYEPLKAEVKERIQARIDELYSVFVSTVARNRGMDEQAIRDTEALTFTANQAVSNKLADAIGSLDDAVAAFAADLSLDDEDETMAMTDEEKAAAATAVETAKTEGVAEGTKAGARTERERISAIMESDEGKKRPIAAKAAAFDTEMTVEQATAFLAKLPEEKPEQAAAPVDPNAPKGKDGAAADFAAAMEKGGNPDLAAAPAPGDDEKPTRAQAALNRVKGVPKKAA